MSFAVETQLVLVLYFLYLYDCLVMFGDNQAIIIAGHNGSLKLEFGKEIPYSPKRFIFLNPFMSYMPVFIIDINDIKDDERLMGIKKNIAEQAIVLDGLKVAQLLCAFCTMILLPVAITMPHVSFILISLAMVYCMIIILLVYVYFAVAALHISRNFFWGVAFESLICPPCSANLIRKISQQVNIYHTGAGIVSK